MIYTKQKPNIHIKLFSRAKKSFRSLSEKFLKESVNFVMFIFLLLWLISAIFFSEFTAFKRVSLMHVCSHHHHTPSPQSMNNLAGKIVTTQTWIGNNNTRLCKWCQSIVSLYYANIGKEDIITIILRITLPVMDNENEGMGLNHNIVPLFVLFLKTFTFV